MCERAEQRAEYWLIITSEKLKNPDKSLKHSDYERAKKRAKKLSLW